MRRFTIHLNDDRFDDFGLEEALRMIEDMIRHDLWHLSDPHVFELKIECGPIIEESEAASG